MYLETAELIAEFDSHSRTFGQVTQKANYKPGVAYFVSDECRRIAEALHHDDDTSRDWAALAKTWRDRREWAWNVSQSIKIH